MSRSPASSIAVESEGDTGLPDFDRLVLRPAREMAAGQVMAEGTFAALAAELGDELTVELTIIIAFYCGVVRLLATPGTMSSRNISRISTAFRFGEGGFRTSSE